MAIRIYNTLTRKKEELVPNEPGKIKMYLCGPTVYDYFHIGNARPFVMFDIFRRYLQYRGFAVKYVVNLTDIDDRIIKKSIEEKIPAADVAKKYSAAFFDDIKKLGINRADEHPTATENIAAIIDLISKLVDQGLAYEIDGDVYYSVEKFSGYGKLSGKNISELESGARVEVDPRKKNPLDFALWKAAKPGEPYWESPWGKGRPGWHIECSAMSMRYLGETIDIHAGGMDLIFPHHENEIAQSEGATGKPFVKYWLHNGFLNIEGEKMSKSLGNFFTAREILAKYHPAVIRMFFLLKHYRSPINFSEERILEAQHALERIINAVQNIEQALLTNPYQRSTAEADLADSINAIKKQFLDELDDDFNTAGAIAKIFDLVKEANVIFAKEKLAEADYLALKLIKELIEEFDMFLGILSYKEMTRVSVGEDRLIEILIDLRKKLRDEKLWKLADNVRDQLAQVGIEIMDHAEKTTWRKK